MELSHNSKSYYLNKITYVNLRWIAYTGQIFTMLILTVAAAEAAIGLAIIVSYYRNRGSVRVEEINEMKG